MRCIGVSLAFFTYRFLSSISLHVEAVEKKNFFVFGEVELCYITFHLKGFISLITSVC